MTITSLNITNFRNLNLVNLVPQQCGLNIICGNNGSGKTSLLESIYYLGLGRSFRTSTAARLILQGANKFSLFSHIVNESQRLIPIGVERDLKGMTRLRVAEQDVSSITELASYLPIRLINSQSHNVFESGPVFRRKYLDWGLFYQTESFLPYWRQYERILKQRNTILRERRPKNELNPWTEELIKYGLTLNQQREEYVMSLLPFITEMTYELLGIKNLKLNYQPGWVGDYASILANSYPDEMRLGCTQYGPHRADLDITIQGVPVKHFLSRGQQKLLICAMIFAQGQLLMRQANKRLIYLVDDLPAELDLLSKQKLIELLARQKTQIFITTIESKDICEFISDEFEVPIKVFHVEHGNIVDMAEILQP